MDSLYFYINDVIRSVYFTHTNKGNPLQNHYLEKISFLCLTFFKKRQIENLKRCKNCKMLFQKQNKHFLRKRHVESWEILKYIYIYYRVISWFFNGILVEEKHTPMIKIKNKLLSFNWSRFQKPTNIASFKKQQKIIWLYNLKGQERHKWY